MLCAHSTEHAQCVTCQNDPAAASTSSGKRRIMLYRINGYYVTDVGEYPNILLIVEIQSNFLPRNWNLLARVTLIGWKTQANKIS